MPDSFILSMNDEGRENVFLFNLFHGLLFNFIVFILDIIPGYYLNKNVDLRIFYIVFVMPLYFPGLDIVAPLFSLTFNP